MTTQEDVATVMGSYWNHRSAERGAVNPETRPVHPLHPPRTRPADLVPDSEDSSASNKVHLVVRPLGSERTMRSLTLNSIGDEMESNMIEEESQCSVMLYENGTGPLSASGSDVVSATSPSGVDKTSNCEPNFRNCLAKTAIPSVAGYVHNNTDDPAPIPASIQAPIPALSRKPDDFPIELVGPVEPNGEISCQDGDGLRPPQDVEPGSKAGPPSDGIVAELSTVEATDSANCTTVVGMESAPLMEANVEKKVVAHKNKLPMAVLKPENRRAIRYWLDQRRAARCVTESKAVEEDEPERSYEPEEYDLFHVGREQGVHDALGQRVLQVMIVDCLFSFSF